MTEKEIIIAFKQSDSKNFKDWAIDEIIRIQKTNRQLAGDYGAALSKIGDLQIKLKEVYNPE